MRSIDFASAPTDRRGVRNDLFCTVDGARDLGDKAILHRSHRAWLFETFGVTVVTITEPAERLRMAS